MAFLSEQALYAIFSSSGGYNFLNQQVCSLFRTLIPKVDYLTYLNQLIKDGKEPENFMPSEKLMLLALDKDLLHLLGANKEYIPVEICDIAAAKGNLEMMKWAVENEFECDVVTYAHASGENYLEILEWLKSMDFPQSEISCKHAAWKGNLKVLKWLREQGCPWNEDVCSSAALDGHLEVLQWARANGCEWDVYVCSGAAENGHLEVLQWAHANGCDCPDWVSAHAAYHGQLEILKWLKSVGCFDERFFTLVTST
nr:ankyrin repeat protein [Cedratvirus plubellavi]